MRLLKPHSVTSPNLQDTEIKSKCGLARPLCQLYRELRKKIRTTVVHPSNFYATNYSFIFLTCRANQLRSPPLSSKEGFSASVFCITNADRKSVTYQYKKKERKLLDEISNVHWHLFDLCAVKLLNFSHHTDILSGDKVDSDTLSTETSATANTVDIVFSICG